MASEKKDEKSAKSLESADRIQITVCGPNGSGKTSLIHRILHDTLLEKTPVPTQNTQIFTQTFFFSPSHFTKPEDKKDTSIICSELINQELFDPRYSKINSGMYFSSAEHILIVVDIKTPPSPEELKEYFKLAGDQNREKICLIVNKIDGSDQFDETKNPIKLLLEKANLNDIPVHYVSTKNNDGIEKLKGYLGIFNHSPRGIPLTTQIP